MTTTSTRTNQAAHVGLLLLCAFGVGCAVPVGDETGAAASAALSEETDPAHIDEVTAFARASARRDGGRRLDLELERELSFDELAASSPAEIYASSILVAETQLGPPWEPDPGVQPFVILTCDFSWFGWAWSNCVAHEVAGVTCEQAGLSAGVSYYTGTVSGTVSTCYDPV